MEQTKYKALHWWRLQEPRMRRSYTDVYYGMNRDEATLTGREIEVIWKLHDTPNPDHPEYRNIHNHQTKTPH